MNGSDVLNGSEPVRLLISDQLIRGKFVHKLLTLSYLWSITIYGQLRLH